MHHAQFIFSLLNPPAYFFPSLPDAFSNLDAFSDFFPSSRMPFPISSPKTQHNYNEHSKYSIIPLLCTPTTPAAQDPMSSLPPKNKVSMVYPPPPINDTEREVGGEVKGFPK